MTDVEVLSRAVQQMRANAEAASYVPGRWAVDVAGPVAEMSWLGRSHDVLTATWRQASHVNGWNPATAFAVAAWIEALARDLEGAGGDRSACDSPGDVQCALLVAHAYLSEMP